MHLKTLARLLDETVRCGGALADPDTSWLWCRACYRPSVVARATQEMGQAYISLMAFAATADLKTIVLATDCDTWSNSLNPTMEPLVALLVDNRGTSG